ncbi:hypothetical protein N9V90_03165 [Endozoicomonas sp.]|nr:hypothetical protein [Endozoicomonas sp.]
METKSVLKTLLKVFIAAPLLTASILSQALESLSVSEEDKSLPVPTIDEQNDTGEAKSSDYKFELSANEDSETSDDETKENTEYTLKLAVNDDAESSESDEDQKSTNG